MNQLSPPDFTSFFFFFFKLTWWFLRGAQVWQKMRCVLIHSQESSPLQQESARWLPGIPGTCFVGCWPVFGPPHPAPHWSHPPSLPHSPGSPTWWTQCCCYCFHSAGGKKRAECYTLSYKEEGPVSESGFILKTLRSNPNLFSISERVLPLVHRNIKRLISGTQIKWFTMATSRIKTLDHTFP